MRKSLYYGGSFNPIHLGHLICCRAALENADYDRVVLIPAGQPPHKAIDSAIATASQRLEMVRLAVGNSDGLSVDSLEIDREGASYTVDTAQQLLNRDQHGADGSIDWLIGADTLPRLTTWHDWPRLFRLVNFLVMQRPGSLIDWDDAIPSGCRARAVVTPAIDISATDIRRRVANGKSIDFLTPAPVVRYIADNGLYRNR